MKASLSQGELYHITLGSIVSLTNYAMVSRRNVLVECIIHVVNQYAAMIYPNIALYILLVQLAIATFLLASGKFPQNKSTLSEVYFASIDDIRFIIISCVAIAIFASDSDLYNLKSDKLGKSMDYGLQLMDIGVGSFVFNSGFFAVKATFNKKIKNILLSLTLGTLRLLSKLYLKVEVDDREFGLHLNFFYLLAFLNIVSFIVHMPQRLLVGMFLCLFHNALFYIFNYKDFIYNTTRSNFITANIEGIAFIIPQLGMYLIASEFGELVFNTRPPLEILPRYLLCLVALMISLPLQESNRRLHNFTFCMIIVVLHLTGGIMFYFYERHFSASRIKNIRHFASRNLLFILLWSNMLVLISRMIMDIRHVRHVYCHMAVVLYYLCVFWVPYTILGKKQKLY